MSSVHKSVFNLESGELTAVVVDRNVFDDVVEMLIGDADKEEIEDLKSDGFIPLIFRGSATASIFTKLGVNTQFMSICIRGFASRVITNGGLAAIAGAIIEAKKSFAGSENTEI